MALFGTISKEEGNGYVPERTIEAFIAGDMDAFKFVYNKFRERIFSYCLYVMGNNTSAEDAFQEVFVKVYTHRSQLRHTKAIKSWLLMVARSVCMNQLRTSVYTPDIISLDEHRDDDRSDHLELSFLGMNPEMPEQIFQMAFQEIGPIYRDAFILREIEGYTYEEIAEMTGATTMNVKVRINRAKKMLREILAPHFDMEFEKKESEEKGKEAKKKPNVQSSVLTTI